MDESPTRSNKPFRVKREEVIPAPGDLVCGDSGTAETAVAASFRCCSLATKETPAGHSPYIGGAPNFRGQQNKNENSQDPKDTGIHVTRPTDSKDTEHNARGGFLSARPDTKAINDTVAKIHSQLKHNTCTQRCESVAKNNPTMTTPAAIRRLRISNDTRGAPANTSLHEQIKVETPQLQAERGGHALKRHHQIRLDAPPMPGMMDDVSAILKQACEALGRYGGESAAMDDGADGVFRSSAPSNSPSDGRFGASANAAAASREAKMSGDDQSDAAAPSSPTRPGRAPMSRPRHRLSLSEYRKAEPSMRLTDADPTRSINDHYDLYSHPRCRVLGHGASSTVRLAVDRSDPSTLVAVKSIAKYDVLFSRRGSPRGGNRRRRMLDEFTILKSLADVPNVVGLLDVFEDEDEVQLVLEYCAGGELFDAIHRKRQAMRRHSSSPSSSSGHGSGYTEVQAARIISQLLEALSTLHDRGVVHRDVKPENVLLMSSDEGETDVKLSDFGLARSLHRHHHQHKSPRRQPESAYDSTSSSGSESDGDGSTSSSSSGNDSPITPPSVLRTRAYSTVGSNFYAAPEVEAGAGYDTQCDVYSLGVTLYILLCGFPPSQGSGGRRRNGGGGVMSDDDGDLGYSSASDCEGGESSDEEEEMSASAVSQDQEDDDDDAAVDFPGTHWKTVSEEAKDLVRSMLHRDPSVRITAGDALGHVWIVQNKKGLQDEENTDAAAARTDLEEPPNTTSNDNRVYNGRKRGSSVFVDPVDSPKVGPENRSIRRRLSGEEEAVAPLPAPAAAAPSAVVPPLTLAYGQSAAVFSMADLCSRISSVAEAASAAAAGYMCSDGEDNQDEEDGGGGSNAMEDVSMTAPLSV